MGFSRGESSDSNSNGSTSGNGEKQPFFTTPIEQGAPVTEQMTVSQEATPEMNNSEPITQPEILVPQRLSPIERFPLLKQVKEERAIKSPTEEVLSATIQSLGGKYKSLGTTYRSIFDERLTWNLGTQGRGEPQNPEDVVDAAALRDLDYFPSGKERELERLIIKILDRKKEQKTLWQKAKSWLGHRVT